MPHASEDRALDLARAIGATIRTARRESRWSQDEVARRLGSSQAAVSRLEAGSTRDVDARLASKALDLLGIRLLFDGRTLGLAGRREQNDLVHAACAGYVARRLGRAGWHVLLEVEVGDGRGRGWIDLLAFRESDRSLLVVEIKTEIIDVGGIIRTVGWYGREAWTAARQQSWRPRTVTAAMLLLASTENDARSRANREALKAAFPANGAELASWIRKPAGRAPRAAIAMVDPRCRAADWLRSTTSDGRRRAAPYADYGEAARRLRRR